MKAYILAQLVEHLPSTQVVAGSIPAYETTALLTCAE